MRWQSAAIAELKSALEDTSAAVLRDCIIFIVAASVSDGEHFSHTIDIILVRTSRAAKDSPLIPIPPISIPAPSCHRV